MFFVEEEIKKKITELFTKEHGNGAGSIAGHHSRALAIEDTVPGLHYTFTDLAQIVSQQPIKRSSSSESSSDDLFSVKDGLSDTEHEESKSANLTQAEAVIDGGIESSSETPVKNSAHRNLMQSLSTA